MTQKIPLEHPALYVDLYELTMAQGYFLSGWHEQPATFDYFFRRNPFGGGYVIFSGMHELLEVLGRFTFDRQALDFLRGQGFGADFLDYLATMRLQVSIDAMKEGEVVFPLEPVARFQGPLLQVQLIETLVLNLLNFSSLVATKAARIRRSAGPDRVLLDFGLRRAQGLGGLSATRAAIVGGFNGTSNVYAGLTDGLHLAGTMAHSWVQSFDSELQAFRAYAGYYPDRCILLVDTYGTLQSGVPNAITVAKELEAQGHRLQAIRLDSGDLAYLSKRARAMLDEAGLGYVKIAVTNQLDEHLIKSLITEQHAPIDIFGVGTRLVTAHDSPALDGVYKLAAIGDSPRLKVSENIEKVTLPGIKQVIRYSDSAGHFYADGMYCGHETPDHHLIHPTNPHKNVDLAGFTSEPLYHRFVENGQRVDGYGGLEQSAAYARSRLMQLHEAHLRFDYPHMYKVGISRRLKELRDHFMEQRTPG